MPFRASLALLSTVVVAITVGIAGFIISHTRGLTLEEHQRSMNSMSIILAEQTSRDFQVIDLILREVQAKIADVRIVDPAEIQHRLGTEEVHHYLAGRLKNVPQADAIVLINADGHHPTRGLVAPMATGGLFRGKALAVRH